MKVLFKNIFLLVLFFIINNCSNTRVIVEGVKTVINNDKPEKRKKNEPNATKGHYKIGQPYIVNNVKYTPKLVSHL